MKEICKYYLVFLLSFFLGFTTFAQSLEELLPKVNVIESNNPSSCFFYLSAPSTISTGEDPYLAILDNYGTPVFYRKIEPTAQTFYKTRDGRMAYFSGYPRKLYFLNDYLDIMDSIGLSGDGNILDTHDYFVTEDQHIILLGYRQRLVDMRSVVEGGQEFATVKDLVIQEFDRDKNLIFNWNSADHFQITDANEASIYVDFTSSVIDYVHVNSVFVDSDTSLLVSSRYLEEITKIDRRSGEVIWRLGGKNNQFLFINDPIGFSHQHSINKLENGNILLFDNGNLHENTVSSIVEYELDENNKTATLVKRIHHDSDVYVNFLGYTQEVKSGNYIAGWGHEKPSLSEYNSDGLLTLELDFSDHSYSNTTFKGEWSQSVFNFSIDSLEFIAQDNDLVKKEVFVYNNTNKSVALSSFSSHSDVFMLDVHFPLSINPNSSIPIDIVFYPNRTSSGYQNDVITLNSDLEYERIATQIYLEGYRPDKEAPQVSIIPQGGLISTDTSIVITFSEPVRHLDDKLLSNESIKNLFVFKKENTDGEDISYNSVVNTSKTKIELFPKTTLEENQTYFVSLDPFLEDYNNNPISYVQAEFSTGIISEVFELTPELVKLYPNPSRGNVFLVFQEGGIFDIRIFNINGILVYQRQNYLSLNHTIPQGRLSPGVYFIKIWNKESKNEYRQKFILFE